MTIKRKNLSPGLIGFLVAIGIFYSAAWSVSRAADTAALIPPGVSQFFDNNGNPLTSGKVYFYAAGTSTLKTTWKDSAEVTPNTNPITLDAGGKAIIYGSGNYRQVVKDRNGNLIWDAVTAPGGGGSSPTSVGDGNLVGTILPWSGLVAPAQYVFTYGQELARATYPEYYTAVTQQLNVICSSASNILTGIADTSQVKIGSAIELPLCVAAGTTVTTKTSATITLSNPSSVSINSVATFFPWGNGNGSTTFNVPDLRGYVMAGRDNMGGSSAGRITTAACLNSITPDALGAVCGSSTHTQTLAELAAHTHSVVDPGHTHAPIGGTNILSTNSGSTYPTGGGSNGLSTTLGTATTGVTNTITGSSVPFSIVQPTITLNYIAKVTPDTSTSIATGVYSIGGMTGVIACGTGILCTGNIVSWDGSSLAGGVTNNVQYNNVGTLAGSPNFSFISPNNLTLGAAGTSFAFDIFGLTSGRIRQTVPAIAGTSNVAWGNSSGTPAVVATSPLLINSTTGTVSISPDALTRVNDTNVTLTLGGSATTALVNPASLTLGWSGQLAATRGGTGLASGNSGGVLFFNSTTTISSSNLLTANQLIIGGGAGIAPSTIACATTTTVVHGGTPPTCGQIVAADVTTNTITNSNLSQTGAATFKGNPTNATANVQDFTIQGLTARGPPDASNDKIPIYDNSAGTIKYVTPGQVASAATSGVSTLNGLTGALSIAAGSGISVSASVATITLSNTGFITAATKADQQTGTSNTVAVAPLHQQDHDSAAKAWAQFTVSGGVATLNSSYNVTSITRNSAGDYTVNFTTAFANANYSCTASSGGGSATQGFLISAPGGANPTVSAWRYVNFNTSFVATDTPFSNVHCFGRQ